MSVENVIRKLIVSNVPEDQREALFRELDGTTDDESIRYDATGAQLDEDGNRLDVPDDEPPADPDSEEFVEVEGDDPEGRE